MKNKIFYVISLVISCLVGACFTYITMTKQQMDIILEAQTSQTVKSSVTLSTSENQNTDGADTTLHSSKKQNNKIEQLINKKENLSINDFSQTQAQQLIDNMPNVVLEQYIDKFMANGTSNVLTDKRRFAQRAIEELYQPNNSQPLVGEVKLSFSNNMPNHSVDTRSLYKKQKLYAHLDTLGQIPKSQFVFVKWVNNTTGQVLLFEKKDILAESKKNWVSFVPNNSWEVGDYDVKFYQFTSELTPIAQVSYQIHEVKETEETISKKSSNVINMS